MVDYSVFTADELRAAANSRWARMQDKAVHGIELDRLAFELKQLSDALADQQAESPVGQGAYLGGEWFGGYYGGA
jgi:hypothetical protein